MEETFSPAQLSKELQVSATSLRRYEQLGLVPDVPRTAGNRRTYTALHRQAFIALLALVKGFGVAGSYETMSLVKRGLVEQALWHINSELHRMHIEKQRVEEIVKLIHRTDLPNRGGRPVPETMNIGEAAAIAGVNPSAIRHWEREGLIRSERNPENGYRTFAPRELNKIVVLSSLRKTVYFIDSMRQLLDALETQDLTAIERSFQVALKQLNMQLTDRMNGISELMRYVDVWTNVSRNTRRTHPS